MSDILTRILSSIRSDGPSKTLAKCLRYLSRPYRTGRFNVMQNGTPHKYSQKSTKTLDIGAARKARVAQDPL